MAASRVCVPSLSLYLRGPLCALKMFSRVNVSRINVSHAHARTGRGPAARFNTIWPPGTPSVPACAAHRSQPIHRPALMDFQSRLLIGAVLSSQSAFSGRSCGLRVGLLGWGLSLGSPPPRPRPGYRAWSIISSPRLPQGTWGLPSERGHPPLPAPLGRRSREPQGPAGGLENWSHLQN